MKKVWHYLEDLDEVVYVSDMETHELKYMNKVLRDSLGITDHCEYEGQPCYKVLQGLDIPCPFCTNDRLSEGKFYNWDYYNPFLKAKYSLKDTMVCYDGKKYRMEIALNGSEKGEEKVFYHARSELILNECLKRALDTENAAHALDKIMAYIGEVFMCDRVYTFEIDGEMVNNTYEWCKKGVEPQKDVLQDIGIEAVSWWLEMFERSQALIIKDLDDIKYEYPLTYGILKPQKIVSLAAGPIRNDKKIIGFVGVDNPNSGMLDILESLLDVIGYFISVLMKRRDLSKELHRLSFHDQLTGAYNRNAFSQYYKKEYTLSSLGIIYCDVSGLKKVNDTLGHGKGDELIKNSYDVIHRSVKCGNVYRVGGDEFIVICPDIEKEKFEEEVKILKNNILNDRHNIAVGASWSNTCPIKIDTMISEADKLMYQDKRLYYLGIDDTNEKINLYKQKAQANIKKEDIKFHKYLSENYYDAGVIVRSLTLDSDSQYIFFGDLQTKKYYISDNFRDKFGFEDNIVENLLEKWEERIATPNHRKLYKDSIMSMLQNRMTLHDLRYQVRDISGAVKWIHSRAILQWSDDGKKPLFFSGGLSTQDDSFIIDPITNFPREHSAISRLSPIIEQGEKIPIISFCLNHFTMINDTHGRYAANMLLESIAEKLVSRSGWKIDFYRLDGVKFICIPVETKDFDYERVIKRFRSIIKHEYRMAEVMVKNPVSFGVIHLPVPFDTAQSLIENAIVLLSNAKIKPHEEYLVFSEENIGKTRDASTMAMYLNHDISNQMRNFRVVVQPVVSAFNGGIIGGEVLLRWKYNGEDISPSVFIPLLEKCNAMDSVGKWVYEQAVRTVRAIVPHNPNFYLTFNISYRQIYDKTFLPFMNDCLVKYNVNGRNIVAELTETHFDDDPEQLKKFINSCSVMGIRIALDDFGNGYSSLGLLMKYSAAIVKIDRSLLIEMEASEDKAAFINAIVYACHLFNKKVCVEGVETEEQNNLVKQAGCDHIQGFLYYKPMELPDLFNHV